MDERPANCPDLNCTPLLMRHRICYGRMSRKILDPDYDLFNTHRTCLDGEEDAQINAADCLYDAEGCIAVIKDVLTHSLYNPLPGLAVPDPLGRLSRILGEP